MGEREEGHRILPESDSRSTDITSWLASSLPGRVSFHSAADSTVGQGLGDIYVYNRERGGNGGVKWGSELL